MEKLKENALEFILKNMQENGKLNNVTHYYDYFDVIEGLISINEFDKAKKIITYLSKFQTWNNDFKFEELLDDDGIYNPIHFLSLLTKYLTNLDDTQKELKYFSKIIKKSIKALRNYFDEDYLLFYSYDTRNKNWFINLENVKFLSFADELSDLLNHFDYTSEADELFMLKGKVELGYQRYFVQETWIVGRFSKELEVVENLRFLEKWMVFKTYNSDKKIIEKEIKEVKKNKINFEDILIKLNYFQTLKKNSEDITKEIKKEIKLLEEIPTGIYPKNFSDQTEKSLFHERLEMKKMKNKTLVFNKRNRLRVAALILQL